MKKMIIWAFAASCVAGASSAARGSAMIPGPTGDFEVDYLQFILDHHYSGLRATELAAGTAVVGPTESGPYPGNPPSFPPTPAKGTNDVVLDIAVQSNAAQEMEIVVGQDFLGDWYGITATLDIPPSGAELLNLLEAAAPGDPFNIAFLTNFSAHHVMAISQSLECVSRAGHEELRDYCRNIVQAQTRDVLEMRAELATEYGIVINEPIPGQVSEPAALSIVALGVVGLGVLRVRRSSVKS